MFNMFNDLDFCVVKRTFGIPCPGCGMTRAWFSLLKGDLIKAFYYHPLFLTVPVFIILLILYIRKTNKYKWVEKAILFICILYIIVYFIRLIYGWRG